MLNYPYIQSSEPFISGDYLLLISDVVFDYTYEQHVIDAKLDAVKNKKKIIIFVKSELLLQYVQILLKINKPYVLLTNCNDDMCIPYYSYPQEDKRVVVTFNVLLANPMLIRWYTKNSSIVHEKLYGFPIGPKWQNTSWLFFGEDKTALLKTYNSLCGKAEEKFLNKPVDAPLLYYNTSNTTPAPFYKAHTNIRKIAEEDLLKNGYKQLESKPIEEYLAELSKYKFCISPPGRGIDAHRTWEALMVGTIPIVLRCDSMKNLFEGLPVLVVNSYTEVTDEFLNKKYEEIVAGKYIFEKIYTEWWKSEIRKLVL
jgi:hypothetical protein